MIVYSYIRERNWGYYIITIKLFDNINDWK